MLGRGPVRCRGCAACLLWPWATSSACMSSHTASRWLAGEGSPGAAGTVGTLPAKRSCSPLRCCDGASERSPPWQCVRCCKLEGGRRICRCCADGGLSGDQACSDACVLPGRAAPRLAPRARRVNTARGNALQMRAAWGRGFVRGARAAPDGCKRPAHSVAALRFAPWGGGMSICRAGAAQVELKGRLGLDKMAEFFANLRRSRTRAASAALLRCAPARLQSAPRRAYGRRRAA